MRPPDSSRPLAVCVFVMAICVLATALALFAKDFSIQGRVIDTDKAAVSNMRVKATNEKTKAAITTETNADGDFSLTHVSSGIYDVTFVKDGFEFLLYPHVVVKKGLPVVLNVTVNRSGNPPPR